MVARLLGGFMTNTNPLNMPRTLDEQQSEFTQRRFLAMPLAGAVAWTIVGTASVFLPPSLEGCFFAPSARRCWFSPSQFPFFVQITPRCLCRLASSVV